MRDSDSALSVMRSECMTRVFLADGSSEHLSAIDQTDADDSLRSSSRSSQLTAMMSGALQGLSPVIVMNNVVLKQVTFRPDTDTILTQSS